MRRTLAIARKELRQVRRDPLTLLMLLGLPALMLVLYGFALNFDVRHVALAVEDRDASAASRELVDAFVGSTYFEAARFLAAGEDPSPLLERAAVKGVLVIPRGHGRDVAAGRDAPIQLLLDGTDATTATTILGYAGAMTDAIARRDGSGPGFSLPEGYRPRVWYNPELRSTQFLVPGLIGFILMLTAVLSTAMSVVREKERGTMEQLRVSRVRTWELVVGKCLPYLGISLAATGVILLAARLLFDVRIRGPLPDLLAATLLYLTGALGFGLLLSTLASSQAMAFQIGLGASMLPAILLSGFIFQIRSMPAALQVVTYAVPARYYLVILRGIILKGAGLGPYGREVISLAVYAALVLTIASLRLAKREA